MNRDSVTRLRLDRRLLYRRGWLTPKEREGALEALPDVAHKATTLGGERHEAGAGARPEGSEAPRAS